MEMILNTEKIKQVNDKNLEELHLDKEIEISSSKTELEKSINNILDKGTDYIIKAMPIHNGLKEILIDVKKSLKTKDFKEIIKTALNSSIREGLEILGTPINVLNDIKTLKDAAIKGGLKQALIAGIDIVSNKYINGNLMGDLIKEFFNKTKSFIQSNMFLIKLDSGINKIIDKTKDFKKLCESWYNAYDKLDIENINDIAKKLNHNRRINYTDDEGIKQNKIIQNMTSLINVKKDKLSQMQLQICNDL
ncbi:MAG: hypothetical protein N2749_06170 [Clostridia bacterium]|nr:hypothetical protein [Clostridia bacterium]